MSSTQDKIRHEKEQGDDSNIREKERLELAALEIATKLAHAKRSEAGDKGQEFREREKLALLEETSKSGSTASRRERDIEGGFGGQEELEDRYATTSGEH